MLKKGVLSALTVVTLIGCGGSSSANTTLPGNTPTVPTPGTSTTSNTTTTPSAGDRFPGFEIDRVRLFTADELPDGAADIPVPVPWSPLGARMVHTLDDDGLVVDHAREFYPVLEAFYGTWIELEGIEAVEFANPFLNTRDWVMTIDGVEVTLVVGISRSGDGAYMEVFWPRVDG